MSSEKKYLGANGLLYVWNRVKVELLNKVDKVEGKGLSTNDFTTDDRNKLMNIEDQAQKNVIENIIINGTTATMSGTTATMTIDAGKIDVIKVNNTTQTITNKTVDITVPTKTSDITNNSGFQNATQVQALIDNSIKDITGFEYEIVTVLPATGVKGKIYLILNSSSAQQNIYDEYIYVGDKFEKIGSTEVDLSSYEKADDIKEITNSEIDEILARAE